MEELMRKNNYKKTAFIFILSSIAIGLCGCNTKESDNNSRTLGNVATANKDVSIEGNSDKLKKKVEATPKNKVKKVETSSTDEKNKNTYSNKQKQFALTVPDGYEVYENGGYLYFRTKGDTQIAMVYTSENYATPIDVANSVHPYAYGMTASFNGEETTCQMYGAEVCEDIQIGSLPCKEENATAWFWNDENLNEAVSHEGPLYIIYTVFKNKGIMMFGYTESGDLEQVKSDMKSIVQSLTDCTVTNADKDILSDIATYKSEKADNISFQYPSSWETTENEDGMITIKAPQMSSYYYSGMYIQYMCDENKKYIKEDYAQFAADYETQICQALFNDPVDEKDFSFDSVVSKVTTDVKVNGKDGIYFEVGDVLYPNNIKARSALPISGSTVYNLRYCFTSNGKDCMINFVYPKEIEDDAKAFAEKVIGSFQ